MSSEMSAGIRGLLMTPARPPTFFAVISHEVGAHCTANSLQPLKGKKFFAELEIAKCKKIIFIWNQNFSGLVGRLSYHIHSLKQTRGMGCKASGL